MPGLRGEHEVEERVDKSRRVDSPLHDRPIALSVDARDDGRGGEVALELVPLRQDVVEVPELEGSARGLEHQDHEDGDDRQPELRGTELASAAGTGLDKAFVKYREQIGL